VTSSDIRLTQPALKVLRFLLTNPRKPFPGSEISRETRVGSGTLYPMLARFEAAGWLTSEWEAVNASDVGRPRRRFYTLTGIGYRAARTALEDVQVPVGQLAWTS
jgi:PadR family transcriptional regulator, regulatory protein PadR